MLVTTFFQSIAKPVLSIMITFLRQILFLIPLIYVFPIYWGINGIFAAREAFFLSLIAIPNFLKDDTSSSFVITR